MVERLANGMTRWYAAVSRDASTTLAAHDELMAKGGFSNAMLVRLENGRRVLQDNDDAQATPNLVIRNGEGLDGIAMTEIHIQPWGPTCRLPFARLRWTRMCQVNWCWPFSFTATKSTPAG